MLRDDINNALKEAMKAKDEARLSTVRMIKSALMKEKVDSMKELDEAAEMKILTSLLKQRRDAAEMFRTGGRLDQAEKEESESRMIEAYMPALATEDEVAAAIEAALAESGATTAKQMGLVMKAAQAHLAGKRIDGKGLSEKVKARLA